MSDPEAMCDALRTGDLRTVTTCLAAGLYPSEIVWNEAVQEHWTWLHFAVAASAHREGLVDLLLGAGANPRRTLTRRGPDGRFRDFTAADLSRDRGDTALADRIERVAATCGPPWHRDGLARNVQVIRVFYDKASGLQLDPNDWPKPAWVGGDYDGAYPMTAAEALQSIAVDRRLRDKVKEALPLLKRLAQGKEVTLDAMIRAGGGHVHHWSRKTW